MSIVRSSVRSPVRSPVRDALGGSSNAVVYDAASEAFFTACTTPPIDAAKSAINALVVGLKADAIWDDLDVFWPMALETEQAGRLNLKNPGTFTLSAVNTPTFTAKYGWAGNGTTSYLNTGWDASTNGVQFVQNNASFGCWVDAGTDTGSNSAALMGSLDGSYQGNLVYPRTSSDTALARVNSNGTRDATLPVATRYGFTSFERTSSTVVEGYKNGAVMSGSGTPTSATINSFDFFIGAININGTAAEYSNNRISCAFMGKSLGATKQTALYNRFNTFRTAMAAIP